MSSVTVSLYNVINSTTEKYCSMAFIWMDTLKDFIHRLKSDNLVQYNKQYHRKSLLSTVHLNGHTSGFRPETQKLESLCTAQYTGPQEITARNRSFKWSHFRISSRDSKVRTTLYNIMASTTGNHCSVPFIWMVTLKDFVQGLKS